MASEIRVNSLTNRSGLSTVSITDAGVVVAGMVTATSFSGPLTGDVTGNITATNGTFSGNLSVGGVLTYDDVTNIDSVGVITARSGVSVPDGQKIQLGNSNDLQIYHSGSHSLIDEAGTGNLVIRSNLISFERYTNEQLARFTADGSCEFYYDDSKKLETTNTGATITNDLVLNHATGDKAIRWATGGTNKWSLYHNNSAGALVAYDNANNAERLRITSAGKIGIGHQQEGQITKELTIRPANDGGIRLVRPGASGASVMSHLELTTTTSGSVFPSGEAYTVKYNTVNNDQIFTTYAGGGTGGNISFQTGSGSGNEVERLRVDSSGCIRVGNSHSQTTSSNTKRIALGAKASIWGWTSGNINGALTLADNYYWDGGNNRAIEADNAAYLTLRSGTLRYGTTDSTPSAGGVTGLTEKFRVDTSGNLLLGQGHTTASDLAGGFTKRLSIEGTGAANSSIGLVRNANDDNPPYIYFGKSRGTSAGSNTVIGNGDTIGMVNFAGSRGSGSFGDAVNLRAIADANFSGSSSPGRFSVWTTPVNSTGPLESFQVNSAGAVTAPRNVAWSYSRINSGASWGSSTGGSMTYGGRQYRSPLPLFGSSATNYDTHNALSTFTSGNGMGMKFTAPVGGKYLVMLNMTSVKNRTDGDWGSIGLMRNTTAQASTGSLDYMLDTMYYPDSTSTGNQLGWGGSVIISLAQNDYIVPYTMSVENFQSDNQYYFQGYLLG